MLTRYTPWYKLDQTGLEVWSAACDQELVSSVRCSVSTVVFDQLLTARLVEFSAYEFEIEETWLESSYEDEIPTS